MKHDEMTMPELVLDMNTKLGILYLNFGENINHSAVHDTKISCLLGYTQRAELCTEPVRYDHVSCASNFTKRLSKAFASEKSIRVMSSPRTKIKAGALEMAMKKQNTLILMLTGAPPLIFPMGSLNYILIPSQTIVCSKGSRAPTPLYLHKNSRNVHQITLVSSNIPKKVDQDRLVVRGRTGWAVLVTGEGVKQTLVKAIKLRAGELVQNRREEGLQE